MNFKQLLDLTFRLIILKIHFKFYTCTFVHVSFVPNFVINVYANIAAIENQIRKLHSKRLI